jgi:hypothetical protein
METSVSGQGLEAHLRSNLFTNYLSTFVDLGWLCRGMCCVSSLYFHPTCETVREGIEGGEPRADWLTISRLLRMSCCVAAAPPGTINSGFQNSILQHTAATPYKMLPSMIERINLVMAKRHEHLSCLLRICCCVPFCHWTDRQCDMFWLTSTYGIRAQFTIKKILF